MEGIGTRLKSERKRLDLSQQELGAIGGIEANAQGLYERGKRFPNAGYLGAIAEAGVDVLFVITGTRKVLAVEAVTAGDMKLLTELDGLPDDVQDDIKRLVSTLFIADAQV
ncbi:helix-turn-helix domain-containing protein [Pseudomonas sp. DWP3-1-2]|uniref:helix-turn-helix domain-containing protein n=1 Tax=Pseudomonas sp. DWP3-1-2 TaxID=2804645 RepID=UPI003CFA7AA2